MAQDPPRIDIDDIDSLVGYQPEIAALVVEERLDAHPDRMALLVGNPHGLHDVGAGIHVHELRIGVGHPDAVILLADEIVDTERL